MTDSKTERQQFRNICIFCSSDNTSREHIFPQWLRKKVKGSSHKPYNRNTFRRTADDSFKVESYNKNTQNSVFSVTTKKVCQKCNNGWLSQLETSAIPIYSRLTEDSPAALSEADQATISMWASILAIKWDLTHTASSAHTDEDIKFMYRCNFPPPNFRVWIGHCEDLGIEVRHRTVCLRRLNDQYRLPHILNTRSTSMIIGKLAIHVLSHEPDSFEIIRDANIHTTKFKQVWPTEKNFRIDKNETTKITQLDILLTSHCCGMQHDINFLKTVPNINLS